MTNIAIWSIYITFALATTLAIRRVNIGSLNFFDGMLIGTAFYLAAPMFFILMEGELSAPGIMAPNYVPDTDIITTMSLFIAWLFILVTHSLSISKYKRKSPSKQNRLPYDEIYVLKVILLLYATLQVYTFFSSGMAEAGGHWHGSLSEAFESSSSFIIVRNFANSFRTMVFGLLVACHVKGKISTKSAIIIGATVCLFDLFTSFNRITIVYAFIMSAILLRKYWIYVLSATAIIIPTAINISTMWPMFRGLALQDGFSIEGLSKAMETTIRYGSTQHESFASSMNSVFESSNIVVLNYVVNNSGASVPILWGWTYVVRPLSTFIPSTIWPDKPRVFGTYLGEIINGHVGLALNSTLIGEVIANFPIFWPLVLIATLLLFWKAYSLFESIIPGSKAMSFFVAVALWRFDMNFASSSLYALIFLFITIKTIRLLKRLLPNRRKSHVQ